MRTNFINLYYADTEVGAKLNLDAAESLKVLKQFKMELKAAQGEALAMAEKFGPTSKAALDAAKKVAHLKDIIEIPYLLEIQKNSYRDFLQADCDSETRQNAGLQSAFTSVFPIKSLSGNAELQYAGYRLGKPITQSI